MAAARRTVDVDHVAIRRYDATLGDAVLLSFPDKARRRTVLVDCGAGPLPAGPGVRSELVSAIIDDLGDANGRARVDVVIATSRHQAHISGFRDPRWREVEVGEVWLPWTEDPPAPAARRVRDAQQQIARQLVGRTPVGSTARALAERALVDAAALRTLQRGFADEPVRRFLPDVDRTEACFTTALLPGVTIHALGPSRDPEVVRAMVPPASEAYLRAARTTAAAKVSPAPFHPAWTHSPKKLPPHVTPLSAERLQQIHALRAADELGVASALHQAVTETRLLLVFEIGEACLLVSGDPAGRSWTTIARDPAWAELLARTTPLGQKLRKKATREARHVDDELPI